MFPSSKTFYTEENTSTGELNRQSSAENALKRLGGELGAPELIH